jgi:hypothetical protein
MSLLLLFALATLAYDAPDTWRPEETRSGVRLAQWILPGEGSADPAELVIFYFGPGDGGSVEANLERWMSQFTQPDGSPTRDRASVRELEVDGLALTVLDVSGTYVAAVQPGASERRDEASYRMIAVVAEGEGGPWFVRLLGPAATVGAQEAAFDAFLKTLRLQ